MNKPKIEAPTEGAKGIGCSEGSGCRPYLDDWQMNAYLKSQEKWRKHWRTQMPVTWEEKAYGQKLRTLERIQGHAAGWQDGVRWAKRMVKHGRLLPLNDLKPI